MSNDLISRQDAIERATKEHDFYKGATIPTDKARRDELLNVMCWLGELPSAQPEPRWIPCSERLPEERGFYLVSVGAPYKTVRVYEYKPCEGYENENLWKSDDGSYCFNWFVKAWMPLPEPWKGEQE